MTLTPDQQAMLQLVLERGQSYEDIGAVLGVGVDEVRTRARAALTELGGTDPDTEVALTDYLLGQADPIGRADAVRHLQSDAGSRRLASELIGRLREITPDADLPEPPGPRERRTVLGRRKERAPAEAREAEPSGPTAGARFHDTLSQRQQQVIVALIATAVLLLVGVLAITGAFGGEDEDPVPATETEATTAAEEDVLASVPLETRGGGEGSGEASFGLATGDQPYVELELSGLSAPEQGQSYVVWLLLTEDQGYPLSPLQVAADGSFSDRFPIPQFAIPIASRARFVDISLSEDRSLLGNLERAVREEEPILRYQGESALRGEIPATARGQGQGQGGQGGGGG